MLSNSTASAARIELVKAAVERTMPASEARESLAAYPHDYLGVPYLLRTEHIGAALRSFLTGEMTAQELQEWAELLEFRDDIEIAGEAEAETDLIFNILMLLANPELDGRSPFEAAGQMLADFEGRHDQDGT